MNKEITLSYVLTTFNKLPYLVEAMELLLKNVKEDEEIVITDGASTDGTVEYLTELYNQGKIHQFISEPDKGESHGFNKGILMARGEIIKLLTDDDVFYYAGINTCKLYMLNNKSIDIINTHGGWFDPGTKNVISKFTDIYEVKFKLWLNDKLPFAHCCLGLMFRKSILPLIGLLEVGFVRSDAHFSLKYTSLKVNFAWYTGCVYVRILNKSSNSSKYSEIIKNETIKLNNYYGFDIDKSYENLNIEGNTSKRSKNTPFKYFSSFKKLLLNSRFLRKKVYQNEDLTVSNILFADDYLLAEKWLKDVNNSDNSFIC